MYTITLTEDRNHSDLDSTLHVCNASVIKPLMSLSVLIKMFAENANVIQAIRDKGNNQEIREADEVITLWSVNYLHVFVECT